MANNEIILYQADNLPERIEVRIEDQTVWLSQQQMAELFQQTKQNISLHISNCFKEGELDKQATVKESLTVQKEAVAIHEFKQSHDRFLIIDGSELYHIGASLKDLGKKWFAFSRMDSLVEEVLARVKMVNDRK
ncbi:hypothetical protein [Sphingobacterium paucimobilis]|uniref:DNA-binding protein n=1 Tax=Sphingobacterium paucimobilis HER1398 TaxID=1346330 RepID=U2JCN5_9SPHI|nr:hypothetical protein [Sphingobacterium paucimobilis]ERJ60438.1 hypothetical protein M472_16925 [Sphingobacterium paucimobilis HER1398]